MPAESYNFFINILLDTVRNEIAACIEKAYEKLALNEASRMLFFTNKEEMNEYAKKVYKAKIIFENLLWRDCINIHT